MRLVSICIPAYNRPEPLRQALESCFEQTYSNFEVLVGDDSKTDGSDHVAREYSERFPGKIRYERNRPSLGQAANVNRLFDRAHGELLVLLHDDDLLVPNALEQMVALWDTMPQLAAAFGKQYITDKSGKVLLPESENLNHRYHRISENAGKQSVPAVAGIMRMFPNNGYMVRADLARQVRYRSPSLVGEACDTDFGLRLCMQAEQVFFLDEYTSKYRMSDDAISKRHYLQPYTYRMLLEAEVPFEAESARRQALRALAPAAASCLARMNQPGQALHIFLSSNYTTKDKFSLKAVFHLLLIGAAFLRAGSIASVCRKYYQSARKSRDTKGKAETRGVGEFKLPKR